MNIFMLAMGDDYNTINADKLLLPKKALLWSSMEHSSASGLNRLQLLSDIPNKAIDSLLAKFMSESP